MNGLGRLVVYFVLGCCLYYLMGCSWLQEGRYCYCKVESEGCEELSVISDQVENSDSREAEAPGL